MDQTDATRCFYQKRTFTPISVQTGMSEWWEFRWTRRNPFSLRLKQSNRTGAHNMSYHKNEGGVAPAQQHNHSDDTPSNIEECQPNQPNSSLAWRNERFLAALADEQL